MPHRNRSIPLRIKMAVLAITAAGLLAPTAQGSASAQSTSPDLNVLQTAARHVELPVGVNSASASATQQGHRNWNLFFGNESSTAVTNASETVDSGFDPSGFSWGGPVTAFPATQSTPSIAAGEQWGQEGLLSDVPAAFALGYDSTRTVSPQAIPAGGGRQTVTITFTPVDPHFAPPPDPALGVKAAFNVTVDSQLPGVSLVSWTDPTNLGAGEILQSPPAAYPQGLHQWQLDFPQNLNRTYTFTAVLDIPNSSGAPLVFSPDVGIRGQSDVNVCQECTGSSVTAKEPTLDGSTPGAGSVTYTIAETDRTWQVWHSDAYDVQYVGTTTPEVPPSTGKSVTGGGWIHSPKGAYTPQDAHDRDVTGKANIGFEAKYAKSGAAIGTAEFQFEAAHLNFHSGGLDSLTISGQQAMFTGRGTVNRQSGYRFLVSVLHTGSRSGPDRFRIKIWKDTSGQVLYDSQPGAPDQAAATTPLGGGSIVIHG